MASRSENRQKFFDALLATGKTEFTRTEIKAIAKKAGIANPQWFVKDETNKISRGLYKAPGQPSAPAPAWRSSRRCRTAAPPASGTGRRWSG